MGWHALSLLTFDGWRESWGATAPLFWELPSWTRGILQNETYFSGESSYFGIPDCLLHTQKKIFICPESKAIHFIHQSSNNRYTASQEVYKMSHWDFLGCIYSYLDIIYIRIDIAWGISAHTILFHHLLRNKASHFHNLLGLQFTMWITDVEKHSVKRKITIWMIFITAHPLPIIHYLVYIICQMFR